MPTLKITQRSVEAASTEGDRVTIFWDENLTGFGLKITPTGSKIYLAQYRMGGRDSNTQRYTIGRHGVWNAASARAEAEKILRLAAGGTDPRASATELSRVQRDLNFSSYAERFLADYGKRKWVPRAYLSAASNMSRWIVPALRQKALPAITKRDLIAVLDRVPAENPALPRNLFALMRKLFNWAVERGDLDRSPMDSMKPPAAVASRDRVLSDEELFHVILCADEVGPPFGAFIRLLIVSGQRRGEVAGMKWSELDQVRLEWTLPAIRAKNGIASTIPLSEIAQVELNKLAGGTRWPKSGFVFSTTGATPVSGFSKAKARLDRIVESVIGRKIGPWRLHDLRRTFATNMQRLGVRLEVTEALLNHKSGALSGVAGVYQRHDWGPEKRDAIDAWTAKLRDLLFVVGPNQFRNAPLHEIKS